MNVLVIGGAGYIGSHVVLSLLENGFDVTVFDDLSTGDKINLQEGAKFIHGTFFDLVQLGEVMAKGFDAVIHLAALKSAGESMSALERYTTHNISGTIGILDCMVKHQIKNFVFSSSAAVYGEPVYLPVDEKHPTKPINFYGYTKLAVEDLLEWYAKLRGLRYAALRYFNAAGYDVAGRIRGLERNPANLVPILMEAQSGRRGKVEIFGDDYETPDGSCLRDYIHVNDLATGHIESLNYIDKKESSLILNLGTGQAISVLEMVKITEEVTGKPVNYSITTARAGDAAHLVASSELAEKILGWRAVKSDPKTLLDSTWNVYRS